MPKILPHLLERDLIKPNTIRCFEDDSMLERAKFAFDLLRKNEANGEKMVISIDF